MKWLIAILTAFFLAILPWVVKPEQTRNSVNG